MIILKQNADDQTNQKHGQKVDKLSLVVRSIMEDNCCDNEDRKIPETKGLHTGMSDLGHSKRSRLVVEQRRQQLKSECCDRVKQT